MVRLAAVSLMFCLAGCELAGRASALLDVRPNRVSEAEIETHRARFVEHRDPEAFRWLILHGLENTMTVMDVNRVMGDDGERIDNDQRLKAELGEYLQTDVAWKWGPASDGQSVVLFFRDGRLIQYDAGKFAALEHSKTEL